jgi:hypothetical protein
MSANSVAANNSALAGDGFSFKISATATPDARCMFIIYPLLVRRAQTSGGGLLAVHGIPLPDTIFSFEL